MCKVSICIPAYNSVETVRTLLKSIKIQTYKDYEIIITDDSSNYEVQEYITGLGCDKIKYYRNEEQLGATKNCNAAMCRASGEYIKMMHHDDWFTDCDSLKKFVGMLDDNADVEIAFSGTNQVCGKRSTSRCIADDKIRALQKNCRTLYVGNWIGAPSATIIRNNGYLFDPNLKWLVDVELYIKILRQNPNFIFTKEPLVSIGVDDTQLSRSCEYDRKLQAKEYKYVLKKYKFYRYIDCIYMCLKIWVLYLKARILHLN